MSEIFVRKCQKMSEKPSKPRKLEFGHFLNWTG